MVCRVCRVCRFCRVCRVCRFCRVCRVCRVAVAVAVVVGMLGLVFLLLRLLLQLLSLLIVKTKLFCGYFIACVTVSDTVCCTVGVIPEVHVDLNIDSGGGGVFVVDDNDDNVDDAGSYYDNAADDGDCDEVHTFSAAAIATPSLPAEPPVPTLATASGSKRPDSDWQPGTRRT